MQRILIFLFVNGKCYGTLLHRALKTPLTPIQKALNRLEKGHLIMSYYEGKTRIYQFNPAYPLLQELEQLLKKAYTLLPAVEKKDYYVVKNDFTTTLNQKDKIQVLFHVFEKLKNVKEINFNAKTKSAHEGGWSGKGRGEVIVTKESDHVLIFNEKGSWHGKQETEFSFSNVFRWTLDRFAGVISLEHLRRGVDHPVFLFYLIPTSNNSLISHDSHLCDGDAYFGQIRFDQYGLCLNWRAIGPKKNEEMDYHYS